MSKQATHKQCNYINYLLAELNYGDKVTQGKITMQEASSWIPDLEQELDEQEKLEDVYGHGQE